MTQSITGILPAKWQVTATCYYCPLAKNLVTVMVYGDWRSKCVHYEKYKDLGKEKERKQKLNDCPGPNCQPLTEYRDKLLQEEPGGK